MRKVRKLRLAGYEFSLFSRPPMPESRAGVLKRSFGRPHLPEDMRLLFCSRSYKRLELSKSGHKKIYITYLLSRWRWLNLPRRFITIYFSVSLSTDNICLFQKVNYVIQGMSRLNVEIDGNCLYFNRMQFETEISGSSSGFSRISCCRATCNADPE